MKNEKKEKMNALEAALLLGVSPSTITNHIERGNLPAKKRLHEWQIKLSDLQDWARENGLIE